MNATNILALSLIIMIELAQFIACNSLSNSTISANSTISSNLEMSSDIKASAGTACQTTANCSAREGCYQNICYTLKSKSNVFLASFLGGFVGADWFFLSRGKAPYIIAGLFKLFSFGGFGVWWLADWITVLSDGTTDSYGLSLDNSVF